MVRKNLTASHRSVTLERHKACLVRVYGVVANRELNLVNAVNAHRNRFTLAAKVPGQFFLSLNNVLKHRIINCLTGNHKSNHVRADIFKLRVNLNNAVAIIVVAVVSHQLHIINSLSAFVQLNLACNTVSRPEVRAVSIIQFNFYNAFVFRQAHIRLFIKLSLSAGKHIFQSIISVFFSDSIKKQFFVTFDFRHFFPLKILMFYYRRFWQNRE